MGVDIRLMRRLYFPTLAFTLAILFVLGCADEEIPIRYVPDAEPLSDPSLPLAPEVEDDRQYDELGRLREGKERVYQYQIPRGVWLRRASAGLREYELVSSEKALTEFYTHRKYPVIRKGAGYKVLPASSSEPREMEGREDTSPVTLHITRTARNRFKLRFFRARPQNHIPEVNQEFLHERDDLTEEEKATLIKRLQQERGSEETSPTNIQKNTNDSPSPTKPVNRVKRRFNPQVNRNSGKQNVQPRVKEWLESRPGEVFYD